jgi:hypothetical protein
METISMTYRLAVDAFHAYQFVEASYFNYGVFFLAFERLNVFRNDKGSITFEGIDEEIIPNVKDMIRGVFHLPLRTSMVIVSGSSFPKYLKARINVGNSLMDVFEKARELGIEVSKEDEFTLVSHIGQYMDDSNPKEAARKLILKQKCLDHLALEHPSNRTKHYNTACIHFRFKDLEEGFKWLRWTFNYHEGEYAAQWTRRSFFSTTTKELYDGLFFDEDFSVVRDLQEFKEIVDMAKKSMDEEEKAKAVPATVAAPTLGAFIPAVFLDLSDDDGYEVEERESSSDNEMEESASEEGSVSGEAI